MRRSIAIFSVGSLLPLILFGTVVGTMSLRSQKAALEDRARGQADFVATLIERDLAANEHSVRMITQSPAFDTGVDRERFTQIATRLIADQPIWRALSVSDPSGNRILDVPAAIGGSRNGKVVEPESLRRTLSTKKPQVGSMMRGPRGNYAFAVRAPIVRGTTVPFVLSAVVDPIALRDLLLPESLPQGWSTEVIDGAGNIVFRTGDPQGWLGKRAAPAALEALRSGSEDFYRGRLITGEEGVAAWRPIRGSGWSVHVAMPAAAYRAPIVQATQLLVIALLVSLSLVLVLGILLARELKQHRQREAAAIGGQRLEALGRMTGGVAHDFNNLLTPIIGNLDLLQRRIQGDEKTARLIDSALVSAGRARTLVGRLLAFARRQTLTPRDVDVAALVNGLGDLLESSVGSRIEVIVQLDPGTPTAVVDPAQLELAILNLAVNARDAMPSGGRLTIEADGREIESGHNALAAGKYVRISVNDTGTGMDAAVLERAIEPFFTTKGIGKGTGLGLSMVHGLAAQSGGAFFLASQPGLGSTAEIWLPAGAPAKPEAEQEELRACGPARLLLVDDDDLVRVSTADLLRDEGHQVTDAASAAAALKLMRGGETFDAMITDFAMPGQSGADLIHEVRKSLPDLPILLITGFAREVQDIPDDVQRLAKPFRRVEILNRIASLLNDRDAEPEQTSVLA